MKINLNDYTCDVYHVNDKGTMFIKISFPEAGIYINGIRAIKDKVEPDGILIYPPAICTSKNIWKSDFEFDKSKPFWGAVENIALIAANSYLYTGSTNYIAAV